MTRDTIIQIAQDLGYRVEETSLIRTDLYLADEMFLTSAAAEVAPVSTPVDDQEIGAQADHARDPVRLRRPAAARPRQTLVA